MIGEGDGYIVFDTVTYDPVVDEFDPYLLIDFSAVYNNLFVKGLMVSVSVFDLLNSKPPILQPYNGWHPPYPGRSREIVLKLLLHMK